MEMPENGPVHEYGAPVFKSANPCIVKPVTSLNKNEKWVSIEHAVCQLNLLYCISVLGIEMGPRQLTATN